MKVVKCRKCGSEYKMPKITEREVVMNDCPNCRITIPDELKGFFK